MQRELQGIAPQWLQGWGAAEVLQHTLPPPQMGWYPVGRGRGEPTPYKRGCTASIPSSTTPSRLLSLLRHAMHPLWLPSMGYREGLLGTYTLCYSLYGCMQPSLQPTPLGCTTGYSTSGMPRREGVGSHCIPGWYAERAHRIDRVACTPSGVPPCIGVLPHPLLPG